MKVLIVDDSKAMRMIIKRTLGQTDLGKCQVVEAENGKVGLEKYGAENPDLILCDWNMPEMSGLEFLEKLREEGSHTRFGFITSESSAEIKELALKSGAHFVVTKPFNAEGLGSAVCSAAV